ncbi:hypothetical protein BBC27_11875 [Acidithiobacillus ferrivorans]|uniref:Uncharacterized protein n=2 Tax=Acidithiobacillus ferrivorans TaxID=160808 RepID=A0A1B9BY67_9PROT|nr:hypothetical protein BBC27_11875 [Acidithiobacillus ferrivorans]
MMLVTEHHKGVDMNELETIVAAVRAEKARQAAEAADSQEPAVPPVTNTRRAAVWEAANADKVREQTAKRVAAHRARDPEAYRAYMRAYMKNRRAKL